LKALAGQKLRFLEEEEIPPQDYSIAGGAAQVVEHLPSKLSNHEDLSSSPNATKTN
jgi:hypothetical protein